MTLPDLSFNPLEKYKQATDELREIGQEQQKVGTRIMTALWTVWQFKLYQNVGEYDTFDQYVDTEVAESYDRRDYLFDFVYVTERIFDWLARNLVGHPVTGEKITPEYLINTPKMIGKLIRMSQVWQQADDEWRLKAVQLSLTPKKTREDIKDIVDELLDGKTPIKYIAWEDARGGGRTIFCLYAPTDEVTSYIRDQLGRSAKIQQSEPSSW